MFQQCFPHAEERFLATFIRFYRCALTLIAASLILISCNDTPAVKGDNETFITSGTADDGDDQTTGPAASYINPDRTATDGQTK